MDALRREVGRDLWNDAQLSDAEFTVLAHLHSNDEEGVRPAQCARAIGWDSSRLAHQLRRLEKRGLVETRPAGGEDGRATLSRLTPEGRTLYRRAIGPHLDSARRWFADGLTGEELDGLEKSLDSLLSHIRRTAETNTEAEKKDS